MDKSLDNRKLHEETSVVIAEWTPGKTNTDVIVWVNRIKGHLILTNDNGHGVTFDIPQVAPQPPLAPEKSEGLASPIIVTVLIVGLIVFLYRLAYK